MNRIRSTLSSVHLFVCSLMTLPTDHVSKSGLSSGTSSTSRRRRTLTRCGCRIFVQGFDRGCVEAGALSWTRLSSKEVGRAGVAGRGDACRDCIVSNGAAVRSQ
jgi:hypothetical protein